MTVSGCDSLFLPLGGVLGFAFCEKVSYFAKSNLIKHLMLKALSSGIVLVSNISSSLKI